MKIVEVKVRPVTLPYMKAYALSTSEASLSRHVIVELHTDEGIVGLGEAATGANPYFTADTQESMAFMIQNYFAPLLIGEDPFNIEGILEKLEAVTLGKYGNLRSKAAIDNACYDIMGKAFDVPVYQLLGGASRKQFEVSRSLAMGSPDEVVEDAHAKLEMGYKMLTLKGSTDPMADAECFEAVREAVGDDIPLEVDPNQGWPRIDALKACRRLEELDCAGLEQPLQWFDYDGMAMLTASVAFPIIADEMALGPAEASRIAAGRVADMMTIKIAKNGGFNYARRVVSIAQGAGIGCNLGSSHTLGVGTAALLHFAASCPSISEPIGYGSALERFPHDIIAEEIQMSDGVTHVPEGPGLGVSLDEDMMDKYGVTLTVG